MMNIRIVALGDSITNGVRIGVSENDTYRHLLQDELCKSSIKYPRERGGLSHAYPPRTRLEVIPKLEDSSGATGHAVEVINAGVGGDITTTAIYRLERDVLKHNPDYVTIMFGVNDAGYYRPVTDSMADTPRVTAEDFRINLETIVKAIQKVGTVPVLVTPVPMNAAYAHKDFPAYVENGLNYLVDKYADIIRELSSQAALSLIDVHRTFRDNPGTDELVPDGIHPNKAGHRFIADIFVREFTRILQCSTIQNPKSKI